MESTYPARKHQIIGKTAALLGIGKKQCDPARTPRIYQNSFEGICDDADGGYRYWIVVQVFRRDRVV